MRRILRSLPSRAGLTALSLVAAACGDSTPDKDKATDDGGKPDASQTPEAGRPEAGRPEAGAPEAGAPDAAPTIDAGCDLGLPWTDPLSGPPTGALPDVGPGWTIGMKVVDISPTAAELATGKVYMGAYGIGATRAARAVHDRIYARTMVLLTGTTGISMTVIDTPGASNRVFRAIADAASARTNLPRHAVYVGATHTHSGPDLQGIWGFVPNDYRARIIDLVSQSVVEAFDAAVPADLKVSKGTSRNRNRRGWQNPDGSPLTDKELTVLDATATADGARIGTLVNFAAHPVKLGALNLCISRDFVGYLVDHMEEQLGAADKVLYFNGIMGDVSPDGGESTLPDGGAAPAVDEMCAGEGLPPDILAGVMANLAGGYQSARSYGELVATDALATMTTQTAITPGIYRDHNPYRQPVGNLGFVAMMKSIVNPVTGLPFLADYDAVDCGALQAIDTQNNYLRLGTELQMVVFPGEALSRVGLEVKDALEAGTGVPGFTGMNADFRLWLGLTTDSLGYFVRSDEWNIDGADGNKRNNHYEETVSCDITTGDTAARLLKESIMADPSAP